jgi:hypothetical protein
MLGICFKSNLWLIIKKINPPHHKLLHTDPKLGTKLKISFQKVKDTVTSVFHYTPLLMHVTWLQLASYLTHLHSLTQKRSKYLQSTTALLNTLHSQQTQQLRKHLYLFIQFLAWLIRYSFISTPYLQSFPTEDQIFPLANLSFVTINSQQCAMMPESMCFTNYIISVPTSYSNTS